MKRLLLERFAYSPESTEGELFLIDDDNPGPDKVHICWTLELPWKDNTPSVSCIPEASYWLAPHTRPDGRASFIVLGNSVSHAPGHISCTRYGILFHAANRTHELRGCIAPGLDRKPGVLLKSVLGMKALARATKEPFSKTDLMVLTIRHRLTEAVI